MTNLSYRLAEDVHTCICDRRLVFLHLHRNRYLCLSAENTQIALAIFESVYRADFPSQQSAWPGKKVDVIKKALIDNGVLIVDSVRKQPLTLSGIPVAETALDSEARPIERNQLRRYGASFAYAVVAAAWKLRAYSMQRTVASVRHRKRSANRSRKTDRKQLVQLVSAFRSLRPLYPRNYVCLYDSLALIEFLLRHGIYPQWVFGVTAEPFRAHCWVQYRDLILNDTVDHASSYTPIMSVDTD